MELTRELSIATLEGGAVIERMEAALEDILKDCGDVNKIPDSVREITCKVKVKPDETRTILMIGIDINTKLGQNHPVLAKAFFDDDTCQAIEPTGKQQELPLVMPEPKKPITVIGGRQE